MSTSLKTGIDLGTTTSGIATIGADGKPSMIPNREGEVLTPSCVAFPEPGEVVVGQEAKNMLLACEARAVEVKRLLGMRTESGESLPCLSVDGRSYTAEEISAFILKKLADDASAFIGQKIASVVLTVPAYFKDAARRSALNAAEIAGLKARLINEPTAAALAHGLVAEGTRTIMVYDLGGGTFDVSIIRSTDRRVQTLATRGKADLGGTDLDALLMEHVLAEYERQHGARPDATTESDVAALQFLKDAAERGRLSLSTRPKTVLSLAARGKQVSVEVSREEFEGMILPLVTDTMAITATALEDAGLSIGEVDDVVMVGGTSRTPLVRRCFMERFGREPLSVGVEPQLAVTKGAALFAAQESGEGGADAGAGLGRKVEVVDIVPHSLAVDTVDPVTGEHKASVIIPRGTPVPEARSKKTYPLEKDLQVACRVVVCAAEEGVPTQSEDCETVGELYLADLPRQLPREPRIEVQYSFTSDGIIHATATDLVSGKTTGNSFRGQAGMSAEEIEEAREVVEGTLLG